MMAAPLRENESVGDLISWIYIRCVFAAERSRLQHVQVRARFMSRVCGQPCTQNAC